MSSLRLRRRVQTFLDQLSMTCAKYLNPRIEVGKGPAISMESSASFLSLCSASTFDVRFLIFVFAHTSQSSICGGILIGRLRVVIVCIFRNTLGPTWPSRRCHRLYRSILRFSTCCWRVYSGDPSSPSNGSADSLSSIELVMS